MADSSDSPVNNDTVNASVEFPPCGRLLGFDFGTKRIGLAVTNDEQTIASPLENYSRRGEQRDIGYFTSVAADYQIAGLVVGLPVHMSGEEGGKASEARGFGEWVSTALDLPVCYWDERFTSQLADVHLLAAKLTKKQRKSRRDKLAAQIMLQSYLDAPEKRQAPVAYL